MIEPLYVAAREVLLDGALRGHRSTWDDSGCWLHRAAFAERLVELIRRKIGRSTS